MGFKFKDLWNGRPKDIVGIEHHQKGYSFCWNDTTNFVLLIDVS